MKQKHISRLTHARRALRALPRRLTRTHKHLRQRLRYGLGSERVIFVFGCQRSGTKMLMRTVDESPAARIYHEHHAAAFHEYQLRSDRWLKGLVALNGAPVLFFKAICDTQFADKILDRWPEAGAIWIYRGWRDVVNSSIVKWGEHQCEVIDALVRGDHTGLTWQHKGVTEEMLAVLRTHWRPGLGVADGSALFWWLRNQFFESLHLNGHERVHVVRYADLVKHPVMTFAALYDFADLPFDHDVINEVTARSVGRRPPPAVDPHIAQLCDELEARMDAARSVG